MDGITDLMDMSLNKLDREAWHVPVHGVAKSWTRLKDLAPTHACTYIPMHFSSEISLVWKPVQGVSQNPPHSTEYVAQRNVSYPVSRKD